MMEAVVQWATILSPIVAVFLAWYAGKSTANATARQIQAMREGTSEEVENLRKLANLQVETLAVELEREQIKTSLWSQLTAEERTEISRILDCNQMDFKRMMMNDFNAQKPVREQKYIDAYLRELNRLSKQLSQIKEQLK